MCATNAPPPPLRTKKGACDPIPATTRDHGTCFSRRPIRQNPVPTAFTAHHMTKLNKQATVNNAWRRRLHTSLSKASRRRSEELEACLPFRTSGIAVAVDVAGTAVAGTAAAVVAAGNLVGTTRYDGEGKQQPNVSIIMVYVLYGVKTHVNERQPTTTGVGSKVMRHQELWQGLVLCIDIQNRTPSSGENYRKLKR